MSETAKEHEAHSRVTPEGRAMGKSAARAHRIGTPTEAGATHTTKDKKDPP